MSGTAFDFIRIPVLHAAPQCGKQSLYLLRELVDLDVAACRYCGGVIDISSENWRSVIIQLAEEYKNIEILR